MEENNKVRGDGPVNIDYIKIQIETAKNQQQKVQEDINKIIADVKSIPEVKEQWTDPDTFPAILLKQI